MIQLLIVNHLLNHNCIMEINTESTKYSNDIINWALTLHLNVFKLKWIIMRIWVHNECTAISKLKHVIDLKWCIKGSKVHTVCNAIAKYIKWTSIKRWSCFLHMENKTYLRYLCKHPLTLMVFTIVNALLPATQYYLLC